MTISKANAPLLRRCCSHNYFTLFVAGRQAGSPPTHSPAHSTSTRPSLPHRGESANIICRQSSLFYLALRTRTNEHPIFESEPARGAITSTSLHLTTVERETGGRAGTSLAGGRALGVGARERGIFRSAFCSVVSLSLSLHTPPAYRRPARPHMCHTCQCTRPFSAPYFRRAAFRGGVRKFRGRREKCPT